MSFGITVVSMVGLTILHGWPTAKQIGGNGVTMFVVAFIVMKLIVPALHAYHHDDSPGPHAS